MTFRSFLAFFEGLASGSSHEKFAAQASAKARRDVLVEKQHYSSTVLLVAREQRHYEGLSSVQEEVFEEEQGRAGPNGNGSRTSTRSDGKFEVRVSCAGLRL